MTAWSKYQKVYKQEGQEAQDHPQSPASYPDTDWSKYEKAIDHESEESSPHRNVARTAKVVGSEVLGAPVDIAGALARGANWLGGKIRGEPEHDPEELQQRVNATPFSSQWLKGKAEQAFPSLAPQNEGEENEEEQLGLLTNLLTPFGRAKGAKGLDLSKRVGKDSQEILKAARQFGLTDKEASLLLHGERSEAVLGKLAAGSKNVKTALGATSDTLGSIRESLANRGAKFTLSHKAESKLINDITKVRMNLAKTIKSSPDEEATLKFIDDMLGNISNHPGLDAGHLMGQIKSINSASNMEAMRGGKKALQALQGPIREAIHKASPKLGKDYDNWAKLYSKMKRFEKATTLSKMGQFMAESNTAKAAAYIALGTVAGLTGIGAFKAPAAIFALRKISEKLLTDPKWRGLHQMFLHSIKQNAPQRAAKLMNLLKDRVRTEMPDEYEEIDWDSLEKDDQEEAS